MNDYGGILGKYTMSGSMGNRKEKDLERENARLADQVEQLSQKLQKLQTRFDRLSRDNELYHALVDHVPDHIYFKDDKSRFIKVNSAWARDKGIDTPDAATGKSDSDFFPRQFAQHANREEQRILSTGVPVVLKFEKIEREGKWRYYSATKIPVYSADNTPIGTCGITRDITKLIETEHMLESERNLLFTLIDNLPDYIYIKDRDSRFRISNRAHLDALGIEDRSHLVGKSDFDVFSKEAAQRYYDDEQRVMEKEEPLLDKEEIVLTVDNDTKWLSTTKVPYYNSQGHVVGIVGISRDITARKHMEDTLRKMNETLEQRVKERTKELHRANDDLKTSLSQLRFLNFNSYYFSKFVNIKRLCKAIVTQFIAKLENAEGVILVKDGKEGFRYRYGTKRLRSRRRIEAAEKFSNSRKNSDTPRARVISSSDNGIALSDYFGDIAEELPGCCFFPLVNEKKVIAKLLLFTTSSMVEMLQREETVYTTLVAHGASCLNNALYYKEFSEKARIEGEIEAARHIQQKFTPHSKPNLRSIDIKGAYYPAYQIGGDYLDYFQQENGNWVIVIADVCGKGVPAAMVMIMLRSSFRVEGQKNRSAKEILCAVNSAMQENLDDRSFITASCVVIDEKKGHATYARAGHPMMIYACDTSVEYVNSEGVAFGIVRDTAFFESLLEEVSFSLTSGTRYLLYTDGVTDATNRKEQNYGQQRLFRLMRGYLKVDSEALISHIVEDVGTFSRLGSFRDDLTVLSIRVV